MLKWLILIFAIAGQAYSEPLPVCPAGISILDESYPAKFIVMSDAANQGYLEDKMSLLTKVIPEVLQDPNMHVLLIAKKNNFAALQKNLSEEQKKRLQRISKVPSTNWMQDPWVVQFDSKSGAPILRPLLKYNGNFDSVKLLQALSSAMKPELSATISAGLSNSKSSDAMSGQYGGNFLAMGALCLVGSSNLKDQFAPIAKQVCGSATVMKVPTSFLNVGHADEVVKALPVVKLSAESSCPMAIMIASPRKAKKLMQENPDDVLFDFRDNNGEPLRKEDALVQLEDRRYYRMLCMRMMGKKRKTPTARWIEDSFPTDEATQNVDLAPCLSFKNKDFLNFFKEHSDYEKAMDHVQERMDGFIKDLTAQVKKDRPQCALNVIEVPQYFAGKIRQTIRHGFKPRIESAQSLFPNPSNGEVFGDKYLLPDPVNTSFRKDLTQSLTAIGLKPVFLDTHFAHRLQGNFHCSEKTIRLCKPAVK
ncbi:protein-arginine deiminase family protein [Bdellovibrio sp. NC01]|uniref:protein-arginine deiminase family protein n=1 Tax=Bdellovibrio sp. NC01 TaxID=2220073 RepID=UPI0011594572|nr:protein-arginine deiminase family protein [Bdellovibrio sp. NC01]QDK39348.1 hypothetical protein DOE51_17975 [Bdellovibrio sp. NC01]